MPIDPTDRQLSYEIELLKIYVALAAAIAGGSIGLLLGELTTLKLCLATLGIGVTVTLELESQNTRQINPNSYLEHPS